MAVGVIIGILIAPKSGKETRNDLMEKGERLMEMGRESVSDVVKKQKTWHNPVKRKLKK